MRNDSNTVYVCIGTFSVSRTHSDKKPAKRIYDVKNLAHQDIEKELLINIYALRVTWKNNSFCLLIMFYVI